MDYDGIWCIKIFMGFINHLITGKFHNTCKVRPGPGSLLV